MYEFWGEFNVCAVCFKTENTVCQLYAVLKEFCQIGVYSNLKDSLANDWYILVNKLNLG